jgi:large subunit ribosomal protein L32e
MSKELLEKRKEMKSRKPNFLRQDIHKKDRLEAVWRKPRGLQSKVRLKLNGYRRPISSGYSSPKAVRGLHPSGLKQIRVSNVKELENLDFKTDGIIIASTVGMIKRIDIAKKALEKKISVLNIKDLNKFISEYEALVDSKKKDKSQKAKLKETKQKELEKLAEKKEKESKEEVSEKSDTNLDGKVDDQEKDLQKKELDKILTKKEN